LLFGAAAEVASILLFPYVMNDKETRGGGERSLLILEAAGVLGVSRRTVYYRIQEGRLQTIRTRCGSQRVLCSSIEALLRSAVQTTSPDGHPDPDEVEP